MAVGQSTKGTAIATNWLCGRRGRMTDVKWRKGSRKKKRKKNLSVLVQEWDIPKKKRKVPLGS